MRNATAAQLIRAAAELIRIDKDDEGFRVQRGTFARIERVLAENEDGVGNGGRTKYAPGTLTTLLDAIATGVENGVAGTLHPVQ